MLTPGGHNANQPEIDNKVPHSWGMNINYLVQDSVLKTHVSDSKTILCHK